MRRFIVVPIAAVSILALAAPAYGIIQPVSRHLSQCNSNPACDCAGAVLRHRPWQLHMVLAGSGAAPDDQLPARARVRIPAARTLEADGLLRDLWNAIGHAEPRTPAATTAHATALARSPGYCPATPGVRT